jgi:Histidine kinase-, DNA gyrase B-, and HSP90-like ATPase
MSTALISLHTPETPWNYRDESIVVGKDVLEVLSSAMYVDPLAIYREYIQNAADAIDEGRSTNVLSPGEIGTVEIAIDIDKRTVVIRDNGTGIPSDEFETRMTSFGASAKRGTNARGFRGVGRLSGLAYCQELLFRSRSVGEAFVSELRWDCRKAKSLLRSADFSGDLADVVAQSVQVRSIDGKKWPKHFFEVELRAIPRLRNDWLLNPTVIEEYLSQVAPLPFAPQFRFADDIGAILQEHVGLTNITLTVGGKSDPTFRPHRDSFDISGGTDTFQELQTIRIPTLDGGGTAAVGWILHHSYKGAVPRTNLKGLRLRSGNIQVGTNGILEDLFVETRFNSWCVGEIHVVDARIIPNGRRDHYEQNAHYTNLINQLSPLAREISTRCRQSSIRRNWLRQFERQRDQVKRDLEIMKQGSLSAPERNVFATQIEQVLHNMEAALTKAVLKPEAAVLSPVLTKLRRDLNRVNSTKHRAKALASLSPQQRRAYEQVFALVYECSSDKSGAKLMIDRMLASLSRSTKKRKKSQLAR